MWKYRWLGQFAYYQLAAAPGFLHGHAPRCLGQLRFCLSGQMQWGAYENARTNSGKAGITAKGADTRAREAGGTFSSEFAKLPLSSAVDLSLVIDTEFQTAEDILAANCAAAQQGGGGHSKKVGNCLPVNAS